MALLAVSGRITNDVVQPALAGGLVLLAYAVYKHDPVFIAGQATGAFIYIRNLQLILRGRKNEGATQG